MSYLAESGTAEKYSFRWIY